MNRAGFIMAAVGAPLAALLLRPVDRSLSARRNGDGVVWLTSGPDFAGTLDDVWITSDSCGGKPTEVRISGWDARGHPIEETIQVYDEPVTTRHAFREATINFNRR